MRTTDAIRNNIIDKLLTISNKNYLTALNKLVEKNATNTKALNLTKEQIHLLKLSDDDIKNGKLIPQSIVDRNDLKWLKEL